MENDARLTHCAETRQNLVVRIRKETFRTVNAKFKPYIVAFHHF